MRPICLLAVVATALVIATASQARTFNARTLSDVHVGSSKSELVAQRDYSTKVISALVGSWKVAPRHATCWSHVPWSKTCDRARRKLLAHRWLHNLAVRRLARLYPTRPMFSPPSGFPPHHALWMCIHGDPSYRHASGGEAGSWNNADTGHNGHYGGLQMHPGWGYGTSYYASSDSQQVQEWAAERAYAASGHSRAWLEGQWGETISPCWQYA